MDEFFLQFLWKFQKFNSQTLTLTDDQSLIVFQPGFQNEHSGPDFREAKLKIDEITWSGSVEIHYKSSDWIRHNHSKDKAYENVILHVVWIHDQEIAVKGSQLPTLQLSDFVSQDLETTYRKYINQPETIRCADQLSNIPQIQMSTLLDRSLASRLEQKSQLVLDTLREVGEDWEETTYRMIGRNFGFKTNAEPFERLMASMPYSILRKHLHRPEQVHALIFGMAGFLEEVTDQYSESLQAEFDFLKKKYNLSPQLMRHHWKFARMRPANFPTVRLAQFAAMIQGNNQLFARLIGSENLKDIQEMIRQPLPEYWQEHYDFGKVSTRSQKIGKSSLENVIINSLAPVLAAYSKYLDEISYLEKAQTLLEQLPAEKNSIIKKWDAVGVASQHAADSQALIYQYREFCTKKRCLNCNIGISILNRPQ